MALTRKKSTPKFVAAVRSNGRKSRGPRTPAGKQNSSLNALKHGAYGKVELPHMRALGEDPAEFGALLDSMLVSFKPLDGYEELLVTGIAKLYWRLRRVQRGEAAFLASRLQQLERDREWKAHLARRARIDAFREYTSMRQLQDLRAKEANPRSASYSDIIPEGDMNSPESPEKYTSILGTLRTLRTTFLLEGFLGLNRRNLEVVLGDGATCTGSDLMSTYEVCSNDFDKQPADTQKYRREYFLEALDREIQYFEDEFRLYIGREVEVSQVMAEAVLLPSTESLERIVRAEAHLERLIELKRQQLLDWRREKAAANPRSCLPIPGTGFAGNWQEVGPSGTRRELTPADTNRSGRDGLRHKKTHEAREGPVHKTNLSCA